MLPHFPAFALDSPSNFMPNTSPSTGFVHPFLKFGCNRCKVLLSSKGLRLSLRDGHLQDGASQNVSTISILPEQPWQHDPQFGAVTMAQTAANLMDPFLDPCKAPAADQAAFAD